MTRPVVVFFGRQDMTVATPKVGAKIARLKEICEPYFVCSDAHGRLATVDAKGQVVRPRAGRLRSMSYYGVGSFSAARLAAAHGACAIVCQSPYEAAALNVHARSLGGRRHMSWRLVVELHGEYRTAARLYGSRWRRLLVPAADRLATAGLRAADVVRAVNQALADHARQVTPHAQIEVFPALVDLETYREGEPADPRPPGRVLFVGALEYVKGIDVLLEAWRLVQLRSTVPAELRLVGSGRLADAVARRARDDASMVVLGRLEPERVRSEMDAATCLVLPSRSEGLPLVLIEASLRGLPAVATEVGGVPELVRSRETGLLVPKEDPGALAGALLQMLLGDYATSLGREARKRAEAVMPVDVQWSEGMRRVIELCA